MIINKICAFLLAAGLVFQTTAAAQINASSAKRDAATPESDEKAWQLLAAVSRETAQFKLPANRIRALTLVADSMWERDERQARAIFQSALAELQKMFAASELAEGAELTTAEKNKRSFERYALSDLRQNFIMTLSARDSEAGLAALATLKTNETERYDPVSATEDELQLNVTLVARDSNKALEETRQKLQKSGFDYNSELAFRKLFAKDSRLAAELGKTLVARFKNAKIRTAVFTGKAGDVEVAYANVSASSAEQEVIEAWQLISFINTASALNREAARDKEKKTVPVLSDAEMKETVEIVANLYLNSEKEPSFSISTVMPAIMQYAPALAPRIRAKLGEEGARRLDKDIEAYSYSIALREKSPEELAKDAENVAPEDRDRRYQDAASKALKEGEPEIAQKIAARIKERKDYQYLFEQINSALPGYKARRGDMEEVRKMLAGRKTSHEKIAVLTELGTALAAKGEREPAKKLLEEAFQMLPAQIKKQEDLKASLKIATAFSHVEPERAFLILENSVGQMNEYIAAGVKIGEFVDAEWNESDELQTLWMQRLIVQFLPNGVGLMKNLARADFERALGVADKFERPEIRLFLRLYIAQALLDPRAAEKESQKREQYGTKDEMC